MGRNPRTELAVQRQRTIEILDRLAGVVQQAGDSGDVAVVEMFDDGDYPVIPSAVFSCRFVAIGGSEAEGASPTLTTLLGKVYVANVGSRVPVVGEQHIAYSLGDASRWVMEVN